MYWRIDCTEHLILDTNVDNRKQTKQQPQQQQQKQPQRQQQRQQLHNGENSQTEESSGNSSSGNGNGDGLVRRSSGRRPRSATYTTGAPANTRAGRHLPGGRSSGLHDIEVLESTEVIVKWAMSHDSRLLVGVSARAIHLWGLKPFVLLSSLVYDKIEMVGDLVDVVWCPAEYRFFALLSKGYLYEIVVVDSTYKKDGASGTPNPAMPWGSPVISEEGSASLEQVYSFVFPTQHYFARGAGEAHGVLPYALSQRRTYRLPNQSAATCTCPAGSSFVVVTSSYIYRLSWAGGWISIINMKDIYDNPLVEVKQVVHMPQQQQQQQQSQRQDKNKCARDVIFCLFSDGVLYAIFDNKITRTTANGSEQKGTEAIRSQKQNTKEGSNMLTVKMISEGSSSRKERVARSSRFTNLACNLVCGMLAAGLSNGEIFLYKINKNNLVEHKRLEFDQEKGSSVSALSWTPDGMALACGYSTGHIVVRSVQGYELNTTRIVSQAYPEWLTPVSQSLGWSAGSTRLFVFSDCMVSEGSRVRGPRSGRGNSVRSVVAAQQADVLPFVRAAAATIGCEGNTKSICLFSDDKVFLHHCEFEAQDLETQPELLWKVAQVPMNYLSSNWPMRYVAVDEDGKTVAVAGERGVVYYSVDTNKWHMFRNPAQETAIECRGGLLWYRSYLVVACINHECGSQPQILFFPKNKSLDLTSDLHTAIVESRIVSMSCHNSLLLVYCENNTVYQYAIFDDMDFIQVSFRRSISLADVVFDPEYIRSIQWLPSALFDHRPTFLVHEGCTLKVVHETMEERKEGADPRYSLFVVSDQAEFVVTSGVNFGNMHSTVWWFTGTYLYASLISLEDFMDGGTDYLLDETKRLRLRTEFFPAAISADKGMVVGVDQDWTFVEHTVVGLSKLPIRAKLYVHNILDHMLSDGAEQDALMYAACFEHLGFFQHAMEILLHEVLEREAEMQQPGDGGVLVRVLGMLENFSSFYEIVVHCARKTEAAFWHKLFESLGGPETFFQQCIGNGKLETATQSLIILQTLEPTSVNEKNIIALLVKAVEKGDRDLCVEIVRFLQMAARSEDRDMQGLLEKLKQYASVDTKNELEK